MERPRYKIQLTTFDYVIEILSVIVVVCSVVFTLIFFFNAPDIVPVHYDLSGKVDAFGSKNTYLTLPIASLFVYVGVTILAHYPHIFNYPTTVTAENAFSLYKTALRILRIVKLLICLMFLSIIICQLIII
ncbi:MAG: DUF1648 domain-containing protein [Bacteroidales bacterium]|jgi:uncharacterized membrane protein|nr:DUF1648 domain-containing protein [Bacteroidales bacterium]